ncbi:MAG: serpin family protein [FCB group bacterium]|jgi:serpin B
MKNFISIIIVTTLLFINSCTNSNENPKTPIKPLTQEDLHIVSLGNNFGLNLFKEVNREEGDKNIVLSPLSVSMALGMTVNGASGSTRDSMLNTLQMLGLSMDQVNSSYQSLINLLLNLDSKVQFELANSIWYRNTISFEQNFFDVCNKYFNAQVTSLNFEDPSSENTINNWVNIQTKGKITKIIDEIKDNSIMFLINAIYFKGNWTYIFDSTKTINDLFYLTDGSTKICRMMKQFTYLSHFENQEFQAVDLPYGNKKYSMTIFLPTENNNLNNFINEMTQDNYNQWISSLKTDTVDLWMPKFKIEYDIGLNDVLKNLGMGIAFKPYFADFSNMSSSGKNIYISEVKHKTYILVDEEGTEAAAVTSVEDDLTSPRPDKYLMKINRPFVFVIRENNSGTIVFIGKIVEPMD